MYTKLLGLEPVKQRAQATDHRTWSKQTLTINAISSRLINTFSWNPRMVIYLMTVSEYQPLLHKRIRTKNAFGGHCHQCQEAIASRLKAIALSLEATRYEKNPHIGSRWGSLRSALEPRGPCTLCWSPRIDEQRKKRDIGDVLKGIPSPTTQDFKGFQFPWCSGKRKRYSICPSLPLTGT